MRQGSKDSPWVLEGEIATTADLESMKGNSLQLSFRNVLALRLAIFYDAPLAEQRRLVEEGRSISEACFGIVYGLEWPFLAALVALRTKDHEEDVAAGFEVLGNDALCGWTRGLVSF